MAVLRTMDDYAFAAQFRDVIRKMAAQVVEQLRPAYKYAVVQSIDRTSRKCNVIYNGQSNIVTVNMGSIQPNVIGQTVRVGGIPPDRFIEDVMGDSYIAGGGGGGGPADNFSFTQTIPANTWTVIHNLGFEPAVQVFVGGDLVETDYVHDSINQLRVFVPVATTGTVVLS